jgi:hypothetical protein
VAEHLDDPVRQSEDQEHREQRAVDYVHGGRGILNAMWSRADTNSRLGLHPNGQIMKKMQWRWTVVVLALATVATVCLAAKEFVRPVAKPAKTYPAHDAHDSEGVTVAIDPYDRADKLQIFTVDWLERGYLPVFVVVTNDSDQPISLPDIKAQLVTANRSKLNAATTDDLYRRLSNPQRATIPSPLPIPTKKVKGAVNKKSLDEIDAARFGARAVEPHSTQSGFVFFDVSDISSPLPGANFFLMGVQNAKGEELIYFEIPLEKYLNAGK